MKTQLLLLSMVILSKAQEPYLTESLEVSMEDQQNYVRELAKYFFKKSSWQQVFDESKCPEFTEPVYEDHCIVPGDAPIPPLPPMNICKYDPGYEGCPEDPEENPVCTKDNMRLCQPPLACDLDQFKNTDECTSPTVVDCEANPHHKKCRYASKCDIGDTFQSHEDCRKDDPCRENAAMCLTVCDHNQNEESLRCLIERCHLVPEGENCFKCDVCKIERTCKEHNIFTDPRCCPDIYCDEECKEEGDCEETDPEEKCVMGYQVGNAFNEMFYEPVQKHAIDQDGLASFYNCLDKHQREGETIEIKCMKEGVDDGFQKLTVDMATKIKEFEDKYSGANASSNRLINEEHHVKIQGQRATSDSIMPGL